MSINAYPLQWPVGWKRTEWSRRVEGSFGKRTKGPNDTFAPLRELTIFDAVSRVRDELRRMAIADDDLVINSNLKTRLDGLPISTQAQPEDPGVAVYWRESTGENRVMAIDRYKKVQDNLAAIAGTIEAMRSIERYGGAVVLERAFTGFAALPAPGGSSSRHWRDVLGFEGTEGAISAALLRERYRQRAAASHPDREGGSHQAMAAINVAYEQARQELGF